MGKVDKFDPTKIKTCCSSTVPLSKLKRQITDFEKLFANHTSHKGFK